MKEALFCDLGKTWSRLEDSACSLRSVGVAQAPELRPSGVGTTQRRLGATLAPRLQSFQSGFTDFWVIGYDGRVRNGSRQNSEGRNGVAVGNAGNHGESPPTAANYVKDFLGVENG